MFTISPEQWRALSPHLEAALEMSEEECSVWLSSMREQNPAMVQQLETLLQERGVLSQEGFMSDAVLATPCLDNCRNQQLGHYTLISQIGHGGMGTVWLARRNDGRFERQVAVKVLNVSLMGRGGEERFKREGAMLARLQHSHIAQLLDAGVAPSGLPYLVLEYVDGLHIDHYCDQQKLSVESRIRLFLDVVAAIAHAHTKLIVHRDVKPSNVLVRNDGEVKLLDFGIAKLVGPQGQFAHATFTAEGARALTPQYATPEQLRGEEVTTATDVYAQGLLLYELLTGQHCLGPGPHTPARLMHAILHDDFARASEAVVAKPVEGAVADAANRGTTPEKLTRLLRGDLDTILGKALKKDPRERYLSVTAFAEDLRRYLKNQPITARPDTVGYRAAKFVRRNRLMSVLGTLAIVGIAAGGAGTLVQSRNARLQRDFALHQLARAERINSLNELLLSDITPMGKSISADELLEREETIVEREHYDDPIDHVEMLISIGSQYSGEEQNGRALRVLDKAYVLSQRLKDPLLRGRAACELGWAIAPGGDLRRAESLIQEGLRELPLKPDFASVRAICLLRGAEVAYRNGDAKQVLDRAESAQLALAQSPVQTPLEQLNVLTSLASAYQSVGRFRESEATFERAQDRMKYIGYDETQKAVRLFNDWALMLTEAGRPLEAEKLYHRAIELSSTRQNERTVSPTLLHNYAGVLRDLARVTEAAHFAELAQSGASTAGDEFLHCQASLQRARIFRDQHDFVRASAIVAQEEAKLRKQLPPGHYAFASLASDKSLLLQATGNLSMALQFATEAIDIDEASIQVGGQGAAYLPLLLIRRSGVELDLHAAADAEADASRALRLQQGALEAGTESSQMGRAYLAHARALAQLGRSAEASAEFRLAAEHLNATLGPNHPDTVAAHRLAELPSKKKL